MVDWKLHVSSDVIHHWISLLASRPRRAQGVILQWCGVEYDNPWGDIERITLITRFDVILVGRAEPKPGWLARMFGLGQPRRS
jgi:hypothetical protein